ncbi:MAG: oxidoreductase [Deferribacterales bacterium]
MLLKDKVCVITGGAGLLGRRISDSVIAQGGIAVIADINEASAAKAADELGADSRVLDITCEESIRSLIENVVHKYGKIDCLVNNAYPRNNNYGNRFEDVSYADFCENMNLNLGGYFLMCREFCRYFAESGGGVILNIASIYGVIAPKFEIYEEVSFTMPVEYSTIKSGLIHLTKYIAKYFKGKNIRINCVSPGGLLNNQPEKFLNAYNKLGLSKGMLDAEDITGTCVYLLSDMSSYVNGQNIIVDDGVCL